jgi:hypothetical protein
VNRLALFLLLALACGCGEPLRDDPSVTSKATPEQEREAEALVTALDQDLDEVRKLPPAERRTRELAFGKRLEKLLPAMAGTRFENRMLFTLADWRFNYADGEGVDEMLDRLDRTGQPMLKSSFGQELRARLRLRQGRVAEARAIAEPLSERMPECQPLLALVAFHERVGQLAPRVTGRNLTGGPEEPIALRTEPWLLYLFFDRIDDKARFLIQQYQQAITAAKATAAIRLVCVTCESSPLNAVSGLPAGAPPDLLWANPNQGGNREQWLADWKLPLPLPHTALIGPDRTIAAVEVPPEQLTKVPAKKP